MTITIVAAIDQNLGIGKNNDLLIRLKQDLEHFKNLTKGHTVVMGRKTYESIGRPLPNRTNVVISRQKDYQANGCIIYSSIQTVMDFYNPEEQIFIIGGVSLYRDFLPYADEMYLTHIEAKFDADTYFPDYSREAFLKIDKKAYVDEKTNLHFQIQRYRRK